ncbi:MAG TPA: response regulator [Sediminibacterium sp.]|jgi:CheY-like chemotaxis protein
MQTNIHNIEVLLVEDSDEDAELVIRSLKKHNLGNNLVHVSDGVEALDFIFARGEFSDRSVGDIPKVILMDLKMPKMDGLQVLKEIKKDDRTKMIPVIMMTSSKEEKDIVDSYQLGVNSFIVKPVGFENFSKAVAEFGMYWLLINQPPKM